MNQPPPRNARSHIHRCELGIATVIALGLACNAHENKASSPTPSPPPAHSWVNPAERSVRRVVDLPAVLRADETSQIAAKLPGYVERVHVDIGKRVRGPKLNERGLVIEPGDLLAELTIPELDKEALQKAALVSQARAEIEQEQSALVAAAAGVRLAESVVQEGKAGLERAQAVFDRWRLEYERVATLVKSGVIDSQVRDETQNQFRAATAGRMESLARVASSEAALAKAVADRAKIEADIRSARAKLEVAAAESARVAALLGYTKLRAPFDGIVTARRVNPGDFLAAANKEPAFTISRIDPIRVVVQVPESDAAFIRDGLPVHLAIAGQTGEMVAKVARSSWALDEASRTLLVEIDLPNTAGNLRPGSFARAKFSIRFPKQWTVPLACLQRFGDVWQATVQLQGKPAKVQVEIGRADAEFVEVLSFRALSAEPANATTAISAAQAISEKTTFALPGTPPAK